MQSNAELREPSENMLGVAPASSPALARGSSSLAPTAPARATWSCSDHATLYGLRAAGLAAVCAVLLVGCASTSASTLAPRATPTATHVGPPSWWRPSAHLSWQWQLSGTVDTSFAVQLYDVDLFDVPASLVAQLHASGRKVACYLDAGSWENWRPDASQYPATVLGKPLAGWTGERYVDIRRLDVLGPILTARVALCQSKRFDAVEFDNVDGYQNNTGFPLSGADQLRFNRWLAAQAHAHGLAVALKNDPDQVEALVGNFDWALVEQCFQYDECSAWRPFLAAGKPVMEVEYSLAPSQFCPQARALGFNAMAKHLSLDAYRVAC
jgi:hypothetical protein